MAMDSVTEIRDGLCVNAATISGLRTSAYIPATVSPPTFVVGTFTQDFDQAMGRGLDVMVFTCHLYASKADDRSGQRTLDSYLIGTGTKSLKRALQTDKTLGGACRELRVESQQGYGIYDVANTEYFGATFTVRVWG